MPSAAGSTSTPDSQPATSPRPYSTPAISTAPNVPWPRCGPSTPPTPGLATTPAKLPPGSVDSKASLVDAVVIALDAGRIWAEFGFDNPALGAWRTEAALSAFGAGNQTQAVELARSELTIADAWGAPGARGRARRTLGRVLGGNDGLARLSESVQILQDSPARLEHARSLAAHGAALRRAGRRNDAHGVLTRALDLAEICGAARLTENIAVELRTAGFRPRRHRMGGPESLTISERRVADLAAVGNSNRAIAQALFVTTKTVELHLTNTYRKLGIARRSELADRLTLT